AQFFQPSPNGIPASRPDPSLAQNRQPNLAIMPPMAAKNSFPRLAADSDGTIYLAFRHPAGNAMSSSRATGEVIGSIWTGEMVYFDGAQWNGPGVFANADGLSENRPALLALAPGRLLIA